MNKIIVAIDGYSSCGKSTLAKEIAVKLNYIYVDTGAMYRAITLFALKKGLITVDSFDKNKLIKLLPEVNVSFLYNTKINKSETFLNNHNVENEIRGIEVSNYVSKVAQVKEVRSKLIDIQREMQGDKGLVMDGRDIGTVVFPNAELKIFMTANYKIRAQRRFNELQAKGENISYEKIVENINARDNYDINRRENPLIQAEDAIVIDNSEISQDEQLAIAIRYVNEAIKRK